MLPLGELVPLAEVMTGRPRGIARATPQGQGSDHRDDASHLRYNSLAHLLSLLERAGGEWATGWVAFPRHASLFWSKSRA
jgi:hypothetical protein